MSYYCTLPNGKIRYYWEDNPDHTVFLNDPIDGIQGVRQWLLDVIPDNESILDVGCGAGHVVEIFERAERNNKYVGCDNDPRTIGLAKSLFSYARFDQEDCFFLSYKNDSFDNTILFTVVEMVADFRKPIEEAVRVAKKRVIITTFVPLWEERDRNKHKINMYGDYVVNINERKFLDFINSFGFKVSSGTLVKNDKIQYWWWIIEK